MEAIALLTEEESISAILATVNRMTLEGNEIVVMSLLFDLLSACGEEV